MYKNEIGLYSTHIFFGREYKKKELLFLSESNSFFDSCVYVCLKSYFTSSKSTSVTSPSLLPGDWFPAFALGSAPG